MPFDAMTETVDLSQPSLRGLSALLRDSSQWPKGFYWDYASAEHCAIGLAYDQWGCHRIQDMMPQAASRRIFFHCGTYANLCREVAPCDVADAIDCYLGSGGAEIIVP